MPVWPFRWKLSRRSFFGSCTFFWAFNAIATCFVLELYLKLLFVAWRILGQQNANSLGMKWRIRVQNSLLFPGRVGAKIFRWRLEEFCLRFYKSHSRRSVLSGLTKYNYCFLVKNFRLHGDSFFHSFVSTIFQSNRTRARCGVIWILYGMLCYKESPEMF